MQVDSAVPLVAFEGVTFGYGANPAVEDVSLAVRRGDYVALIGPNGSGKTTLVKLALGLERPQKGSVLLFGTPIQRFSEWRRIGYVPQRANAFTVRFPATVGDIVAQGEYRGFDPGAFFRRGVSPQAEEALRTVGMWEHRRRPISELSGGQQQRVLIGRALAHRSELLVLDEPTTGIDRSGQEQFYGLLRSLHRDHGVTIFLISHDVGVVLREATMVACIDCRLLAYASAEKMDDRTLAGLYGHSVDIHRHG